MSQAMMIIIAEREKHPGDDRPILIGQAPSRRGDPTKPLTGRAGERLARISGLQRLEFYLATVRVNVFDEYQGKAGRGTWDAFPVKEAKERAHEIRLHLIGRRVVFVGRMVAEAFGLSGVWCEWNTETVFRWEGSVDRIFRHATCPHPSGRSRFWNDLENTAKAEKFLRELFTAQSAVPRLRALRERGRAIGEAKILRKQG